MRRKKKKKRDDKLLAGAGMRKGKRNGAVVSEEALAALPYQHSALTNKDLCSFSKGCSRGSQSPAFELAPGKLCPRLFLGGK